MHTGEKHKGEGRLEKLARLNVVENIGAFAVLSAGAVLLPPAGAAVAAALAAGEGAGALLSKEVHARLKNKRLKKEAANPNRKK